MPAAQCGFDGYLLGQPSAPSLQENTEKQRVMVHQHIAYSRSATISFSEIMLDLLKNLMVVNFFIVNSHQETPFMDVILRSPAGAGRRRIS